MPIGIRLKSNIVRETLKAKGYDLKQVETGEAQIDDDLKRLLEKLADDKPVIQENCKEEPEVTILRKSGIASDGNTSKDKLTLMGRKWCSHWLKKSQPTYLNGLGLGKREWSSRNKLNT